MSKDNAPDVEVKPAGAPVAEDKLSERLARLKQRLADYEGGVKKLDKLIASRPKSEFMDGWKQRREEYTDGIEGIPPQIAVLEHQIKTRAKQKAAAAAVAAKK